MSCSLSRNQPYYGNGNFNPSPRMPNPVSLINMNSMPGVRGIEDKINWQPYSKTTDGSVPSEAYSELEGAFDHSAPMKEFRRKLMEGNPLYLHPQIADKDPSADKEMMLDMINQNLASMKNESQIPQPAVPAPSGHGVVVDSATMSQMDRALLTPSPSYPNFYPSNRNAAYNPYAPNNYSVMDRLGLREGKINVLKFILGVLAAALIAYGVYYWYTSAGGSEQVRHVGKKISDSLDLDQYNEVFSKKRFRISQ